MSEVDKDEMAPTTPRRSVGPSRTSTGARQLKRRQRASPGIAQSEPPTRKGRYVPGGPGGGGRYIFDDGSEDYVGGTGPGGPSYTGDRGRMGAINAANGVQPPTPKMRRDKSTRTRTATVRSREPKMRFGPTATSAAAAVVQSEGYKPREERGWEEFHPSLDIDITLMLLSADEVDGTAQERPVTPGEPSINGANGTITPKGASHLGEQTPGGSINGDLGRSVPGTPSTRRRLGRPPLNVSASRSVLNRTSSFGRVAPMEIQSAKERLTLPRPSFRKTDSLARFEDKAAGQVRYIDRAMANVGYQETDQWARPDGQLIRFPDGTVDDDLDRVEYDMDEQDVEWLKSYNEEERKDKQITEVTREVFEITVTKVEKEWHALEKRIPKPNPRPPQTHRPRSSSAAAVNGEPQAGEEQDSKCAICDDGDCENTNAIVFCDGCDLAVHQECYGVPFIPEGQWLCRKCQGAGRGLPTCIFCPNSDGGFKQTNSSKWAHLLCAMWIPEVSLGNHTFMEPIMDVERVPKNRWKLSCYLCNQKMGACIQCSNKNCYQAFHVTCARRAHLYLKMKNNHGSLAVLDVSPVLTAFCDKHGSPEYNKENNVAKATKEAKRFYRKKMKGRIWAKSRAAAMELSAHTRHDDSDDEDKIIATALGEQEDGQPPKGIWRLPSGAPIIPSIVFDTIEKSIQRFGIQKRKEFVASICRYWTLKREKRRGAPLIKRLQLQMEGFSSMEITRRNFAGMGPAGKTRLDRRIDFGIRLYEDLEKLKELTLLTDQREATLLQNTRNDVEMMDTVYFPIHKLLIPIFFGEILRLDTKNKILEKALSDIQAKLENRFYIHASSFARDLGSAFSNILASSKTEETSTEETSAQLSPTKKNANEFKERKAFLKRIIKRAEKLLNPAFRAEADVFQKSEEALLQELISIVAAAYELPIEGFEPVEAQDDNLDAMIVDSVVDESASGKDGGDDIDTTRSPKHLAPEDEDAMNIDADDGDAPGEVDEVGVLTPHPTIDEPAHGDSANNAGHIKPGFVNPVKSSDSPPDSNGFIAKAEQDHPNPPTPPISNGAASSSGKDGVIDGVPSLEEGGLPWYLKHVNADGTNITVPKDNDNEEAGSEDLSSMDDEAFKGMDAEMEAEVIEKAEVAPKAKKAKKKRSSRYR